MKRIISIGAALVLTLSTGMTASAGHHTPCMTQVIQGSGLFQYRGSQGSVHHLFRHEGWTDCGFCGMDVDGICDSWGDFGNGYGAGMTDSRQGADEALQGQDTGDAAAQGQDMNNMAAQSQDVGNAAPESQAPVNPSAENQAELQTGDSAPAAETYDENANVPYYGGNGGYGNGGHHEEWSCYPDNYNRGCHGSGHHGRGHH